MYFDGEWFDLTTFYQRLGDLPTPDPPDPDVINENSNESSQTQTTEDSSTNSNDYLSGFEVPVENNDINETYDCSIKLIIEDSSTKPDDGDNKGYISQDQHQTTYDHFAKDSMARLTSRDHLNTKSEDTGENSFRSLVQKPLCGNDNVGKFETFMDEDAESKIVCDPSLGLKSEDPIKEAMLGSDRTTENLGCNFERIDSSYQSSFSEVINEEKSGIVDYLSLGVKSEASTEDAFLCSDPITKKLWCDSESIDSFHQLFSEVIKEEKSRIADDYSLGPKSGASVRETLLDNNRNTKSPQVPKAIKEEKSRITNDYSLGPKSGTSVGETLFGNNRNTKSPELPKAITEEKSRIAYDYSLGPKSGASVGETLFGNNRNTKDISCEKPKAITEKCRIDNDPSFGLKSQVLVEETLIGNYRTTEYPEKVQNDVKEDKSKIDNDPSLEFTTNVSVKENSLDCDKKTENPEKIQKAIPDGSSFKEDINNHPSLAENDEYTNYYLTSSTAMMRVIQKSRKLDEDRILRCKIDSFTCNFCGHKFRSRDELREHKRGYVSFVPSRAHICSRYSQRYCIILGYSSSRYVQFKCSHCQRRFKRFGDYSRHCNNEQICKRLRSYMVSPFVEQCRLDNGEMGFECLLCEESSTVYAELKFHECIISRDLPEKCYEDPPADEDHDDDEDDDSEDESFKCDICGVEFHDTHTYAEHRMDHVRGEKYECKVCYKSFSRLCSFKTHMDVGHKVKTRAKKGQSKT